MFPVFNFFPQYVFSWENASKRYNPSRPPLTLRGGDLVRHIYVKIKRFEK
jgi:hypothetical protein